MQEDYVEETDETDPMVKNLLLLASSIFKLRKVSEANVKHKEEAAYIENGDSKLLDNKIAKFKGKEA